VSADSWTHIDARYGVGGKVTVRADIHYESTGFAIRPEPEVARPETEIAPVDIAAVSKRSQSVESGSEAGEEPQSGCPLPV